VAQRRFHYEVAFERYLRDQGIPYIAVDEAKRALQADTYPPMSLKSFDFVVYTEFGRNLLVDVKGRIHRGGSGRATPNWVTEADVESMQAWQRLFGEQFDPVFVFLYWCRSEAPDALFNEVFEAGGRWYMTLAIRLSDYMQHMKPRSASWATLDMPSKAFRRLAVPFRELANPVEAAGVLLDVE